MKGGAGWLWLIALLFPVLWGLGAIIPVTRGQAAPMEKVIAVEARQFNYSPNIITVNKGDHLRLNLVSRDVYHGFFLDGYELEAKVKRGELSELHFVADKAGRFTFRCSVTCGEFHPYLVGYLRVEPNTTLYGAVLWVLVVGLVSASGTFLVRRGLNHGHGQTSERLLGMIPVDWRFELTRFKVIRRLLKSRWFPFLGIVAALFLLTLTLTAALVGTAAGNHNFGLLAIWLVWWVLLVMILVPFFGRFWCTVCPLPSLGEWLQRFRLIGVKSKLGGLNRRWPRHLSNMWAVNFLFLTVIFFSGFFTVRPIATFYLLAFIIAAAIIISLVYQRRTFCRYLCPINSFQALYSNLSLSEIRCKDQDVCRRHRPKTCYTGTEKGYGCPWLILPYTMERNTHCGMCLECFKTCPYDNLSWNFRPPGTDLLVKAGRGLDEAWNTLTMLGIPMAFYAMTQGPWGFLKDWARAETLAGYLAYVGGVTLFNGLLMPLVLFIFVYFSWKLSGEETSAKQAFVNFSYALLPLALATWGAFTLGKLLPNGSYLVSIISDPFGWGWNLFGTAGFQWHPYFTRVMPYLQVLILVAGLVLALDYGYKIARQTYANQRRRTRGWLPMFVLLITIALFLVWLFVG